MDVIFLIGRILVGLYFLFSGSAHFMQLDMMAQYAQSQNVPQPRLAVVGTGVLLLLGGLSILTGFQTRIGIALLVIFFLGVTPMMHRFWEIEDEQQKMNQMLFFMRNIALLGSVLMFLAIPEPWAFSLG